MQQEPIRSPEDDSNITPDEQTMLNDLEQRDGTSTDDNNLTRAGLDATDNDGDALNEDSSGDGRDLDIPGAEDDDELEDIGEEDEENNGYSEADTD